MTAKTLECPSADCTWTTRDQPEFTAHINENHGGEFQRDDWFTFSNLESTQCKSGIGKEQTIGNDEDNKTDKNDAH